MNGNSKSVLIILLLLVETDFTNASPSPGDPLGVVSAFTLARLAYSQRSDADASQE
jgi:hypothetical protein